MPATRGPALPVGGIRPRNTRRAFPLRLSVWTILIPALLFTGGSMNALAELHCTRAADGTGTCTLRRGSLVLQHTEEFPVSNLVGARILGLVGSSLRNVWVETHQGPMRLTDGGTWTEQERAAVSARITGWVVDGRPGELREGVDARPAWMGGAVLLGLLVAVGVEVRQRRRIRAGTA